MKKKIILHGYLQELYPHPIEVEASSVGEALEVLALIPELTRAPDDRHRVRVEGIETDIALWSVTSLTDIHVHPNLGGEGGGKSSGFFQIAIGVALVAVAMTAPYAGATAFSMGSFSVSYAAIGLMGINLILGGVLQLLMPTPDGLDNGASSRVLSPTQNTVAIGTTIPKIYGTRKTGGHYLSFDVDANVTKGGSKSLYDGVVSWVLQRDKPVDKELVEKMQDYIPNDYDFFDPEQDALYVVYDHTPLTSRPAVICPEYSSNITGPDNIPTSGWSAEVMA